MKFSTKVSFSENFNEIFMQAKFHEILYSPNENYFQCKCGRYAIDALCCVCES